jgi:hypothetical protein
VKHPKATSLDVQVIAGHQGATLEQAESMINDLSKKWVLRVQSSMYSLSNTTGYVYGFEHLANPNGLDWTDVRIPITLIAPAANRRVSLTEFARHGPGKRNLMEGLIVTKLTEATYSEFLREQDPFSNNGCSIDLHSIRFGSPSGMLLLAATCHALHQKGRAPRLNFSPYENTHLPEYLLRANFMNTIKPVAHLNIKFKERWINRYADLQGHNRLLIEVTRLQAGGELPVLLNRFVEVLISTLKYPPVDAYRVATAASEAGRNTFQHNTNTFGFFAMQTRRPGQFWTEPATS